MEKDRARRSSAAARQKELGKFSAALSPPFRADLLRAVQTGAVQDFHRIEPLLLLRCEERPDLPVELLQDHVRVGARFLVNRSELRTSRGHERFDLALLRLGQLQHVGQHAGHLRRSFVAERRCTSGSLPADELRPGEENREAKGDWNQFR